MMDAGRQDDDLKAQAICGREWGCRNEGDDRKTVAKVHRDFWEKEEERG